MLNKKGYRFPRIVTQPVRKDSISSKVYYKIKGVIDFKIIPFLKLKYMIGEKSDKKTNSRFIFSCSIG